MKRNIRWILASILSFSSLLATESYLIEPEEGIKLIDNKNVQFISIGDEKNIILGSKKVDIRDLIKIDILGKMSCEPFYICPNQLKRYLEERGISGRQKLILYDNDYGINASTLYAILEATGNKNIKILNGGIREISDLDPNQRIYNKYLLEKASLLAMDNNDSKKSILKLEKKLSVLRPLLLVNSVEESISIDKSEYILDRKNFKFDYLIGLNSLQQAVSTVRREGKKSNIKIVDACSMIDIVGNKYGSYLSGVYSVNWREVLDVKKRGFKAKNQLEELFQKKNLQKDNELFVYCMGGNQKAFYVGLALRQADFSKVKVFSGNWNVWRRGDIFE